MHTFILTVFWMHVGALCLRLIIMMAANYPRVNETKLGQDVATVLLTAGMTVWAGFLAFWS